MTTKRLVTHTGSRSLAINSDIPPQDGDILKWNAATSMWVPTLDGVTGVEPVQYVNASLTDTRNFVLNYALGIFTKTSGYGLLNAVSYNKDGVEGTKFTGLKAGHSYMMIGSVAMRASTNSAEVAYAWYDSNTNTQLSNLASIFSLNANQTQSNQSLAIAVYSPTVDSEVELRCLYESAPQATAANGAGGIVIYEISSSKIVSYTASGGSSNVVVPNVISDLLDVNTVAAEVGSRLQYDGAKWIAAKDAAAVTGSAPLYFEAGLGPTQEALNGLGFTLSGEAVVQQAAAGNFNSNGIRLIDTVGAGGNGTVGWNPGIDWTKNVRVSFRMFIPNSLTVDDIIVGMAGNLDQSQSIEMSIDPYTGSYKVRKNGTNLTNVPWANAPAGNPTGTWSRFVTEIVSVNGKRILKLMRWIGGELQIAAAGEVTGFGTQFGGLYFYAWNGAAIPSHPVLLQSCQVEYI